MAEQPAASTNVVVPCSRCGEDVELDNETFNVGRDFEVVCKVCVPAPRRLRRFRAVISISEVKSALSDEEEVEEVEELVSFAAEVDALTFKAATGGLGNDLTKLWDRVLDHAPIVDAHPSSGAEG